MIEIISLGVPSNACGLERLVAPSSLHQHVSMSSNGSKNMQAIYVIKS